jgi:predicted transcriptional regulator
LNFNKILRSSCRRKILKTVSEKKAITIMRLVRIVNSTYNEVDRNLRILEREGIVTQRYARHKRVISLNFKNERTLVDLKQFRRSLKRLLENNKKNDS